MITSVARAAEGRVGISRSPYISPERVRAELYIALSLFVATCLFLCCFYNYTNLNGDEGIVLQGAQRILDGQVLYRDFFAFYTPGSYYSTAMLFRLFGNSFLVARGGLVFCGGLFSVLLYLLARRACPRWSALLAVYTASLTCLPFRFLVTHWDSTLCAYLALYCAVLWMERGNWQWAFGTGLFAAFTCLFEQAKGFGVVIGLLAGVVFVFMRTGFSGGLIRKRALWFVAAGLAIPPAITVVYFAAHHGLSDMIRDCSWPLFHYSTTNKTPYGYMVASSNGAELWKSGWGSRILLLLFSGPFLIIPLLPFVGLAVCGRFGFARSSRMRVDRQWAYWVMISSVLSGLLISTILTRRPDFTHLDYLAPLFYIVLAWVFAGLPSKSRLWNAVMPVVALYVFVSATVFGMAMSVGSRGAHQRIETARGVIRTPQDISLQFVLSHVSPGEKMLVYPYEPLYYYLTGTRNPTRFDFLQPGMHTPDQFQQSLTELRADQTRVVLFETSAAEKLVWTSPDTPISVIAAKDPLQDYIFAHYRPCGRTMENQYWRFLFMVRKDLPCA